MKLSVTVISFNHGQYLEQCLESIVNQNTNFEFEVIVADDCSTDDSQNIIKEFQSKHPHLIKPILQQHNTYTVDKKNYKDAIERSNGEYIAYIDGDDMMVQGKLQAQVDYLDRNPDCWMVFHPLIKVDKDGKLKKVKAITKKPAKDKLSLEDYLFPGFTIKHSSKMFRRSAIPVGGFCYDTDKMSLDVVWIVQSFLESGLKAGFIDKPLGYYRQFVGVSQGANYVTKRKEGVLYAVGLVEEKQPKLRDVVSNARLKQEVLEAAENKNWKRVNKLTRASKQYRLLYMISFIPFLASTIFKIKKRYLG